MAESASPKVSIVTIFLDAARFLPEALASVAAQDFADWELLLVDDGSGDGSAAIARAAADADPARVRCLAHPGGGNRGMGASRNLAFAAARGEFLVRLDADDAFASPTALSEQVALLDAHPDCGLVAGPVEYWASWRGGVDAV
jgi:glycosyltransferase involved in cell wall biosynthesis